MTSKPLRTVLTVLMDILIVLAIGLTASLVVQFFGTLAAQGWGEAVIALTAWLKVPFGVEPIKTPYGGVFNVDIALTIGVLVLAEWMLSMVRSRE